MAEYSVTPSDIVKRGKKKKLFVPIEEWAPEDAENPKEYGVYIRAVPATTAFQILEWMGDNNDIKPEFRTKAFQLIFKTCLVDENGNKMFPDAKKMNEVFEVTSMEVINKIFGEAFAQIQETTTPEQAAKNSVEGQTDNS